MKIVLLTNSYLPTIGGAEFVVHHLARQWSLQGHAVTVLNPISDSCPDSRVNYHVRKFTLLRGSSRLGHHRFPFLQYSVRIIKQMLEKESPEIIYAHFGYPVAIWLGQMNPVPRFFITCHGGEINPEEKPRKVYRLSKVLADSLNKAAGVVAISTYARKVLEEMGVDSSRIVYIPNGVDRETFQLSSDFDVRGGFDIPRDAPVILSVGRDNWIKAFNTGIRAFSQLSKRDSSFYYIILGKNTDRWRQLAQELGVGDRVRFGHLSGKALVGAYQQATVFFSSSVYELCPMVVLEAMAAGLPLVVTNVSGSQDMDTTGYNGIVVEPEQPNKMAEALYTVLTETSLQKRFSTANLNKSQYYDWSNISKLYLKNI